MTLADDGRPRRTQTEYDDVRRTADALSGDGLRLDPVMVFQVFSHVCSIESGNRESLEAVGYARMGALPFSVIRREGYGPIQ
jgi:hypothetical protein